MKINLNHARFVLGIILPALGAALPVGAQNFSTIHNFGTIANDGKTPQAALAASGGKLYGATGSGGTNGFGTIFSINTDGSGYANLYDFSAAGTTDGRAPNARLIVSGNTLYGTCVDGGAHGTGTVFRVNTDGSSFTNLHSFAAFGTGGGGELEFGEGPNADGAYLVATLLLSGTNLYGVAQDGGANGNGTVFRVSTDASTFSVIHTFSGAPNGITNVDGGNPFGNLVLIGSNLYGTTLEGGTLGNGTIYNLSLINLNFTTMHSFGGQIFTGYLPGQSDGIEPGAGMVLGPDGNLYGTCENGGENGLGTVFSIPTNSADYGNYETIYAWTAQSVGQQPVDDLVLLGTNLFGVTVDGGPNYNGTLFSLSITGVETNIFTDYYNFAAYNNENENAPNTGGARPYGGLVFAGTNLYGTALDGGSIGYGTAFKFTVPPAILTSYLNSTPPTLQTDVQSPFYVYIGGTVSNSVTVSSPGAVGYQWLFNNVKLTNSATVSGAQGSVLTLANAQGAAAGSYQVIITNAAGSITSSVVTLTVFGSGPIGFNGSGLDWTPTQSGTFTAPVISNGELTLTDNGSTEARGFFFNVPQYIGAFHASFTYLAIGSADGAAFVLQNDPRGVSALGIDGGFLGVGGTTPITPSAELELNLYTGGGENVGYTFLTDGLTGAGAANGNYHSTGTVNLAGGNPIAITMQYAQGQLALTFTDTVTKATFSTNLNVGDLTAIVGGNTAYIGFTGGDGSSTSEQTIGNFSYVGIPAESVSLVSKTLVISWPSAIEQPYILQRTGTLATPAWTTLTNQPTVVAGQNQITIPLATTNVFYRLVLP
ncbi:MAG TPA: choice-of-anchor tandem repeat GloVer-containing protein [Verrucomicrobiae bacterium]|jgi:uncharacterized repeat protein (TIGR03803 family)|nr:choice-of-anchor tandem repeat GloVer-containing protein [Verrucomicrobiae bacterium]